MVRVLIAAAIVNLWAMVVPAGAAPPPIDVYGKLPSMEMVRLSPAGDRYAFIARDNGARRLYVATTDHHALAVKAIGDLKIRRLAWAGEDHVLITATTTVNLGMDFLVQKQELTSVIVLNASTGKSFTVFDGGPQNRVANVVRGEYGTAEIDGHWYGYFGAFSYETDKAAFEPENGRGNLHEVDNVLIPDLYRVDLDTGDLHLQARGDLDIDDWLVTPSGEVAARSYYQEKSGAWRIAPGGFGGKPIASGRTPYGDVAILGLGRTTDSVIVQTPGDNGAQDEEIPLAGGPPRQVFDAEPVGGLLFDVGTRLWIGSTADADETPVTLLSPALQARWDATRKAFPGYIVHLTSYSVDFGHLIVFTEGRDDSGTYWIVDVLAGSAKPLGYAYPDVKEEDVGPVRMIDYKAADGLALRGVLTLPPGREAKNLPLVVMPHGGPAARDYPGFDWWAQAFASRGYAVFQPNFRGSDGYGDKFREAGYGEWGRKMQTDISDGVAELARQGIVDPKRACIVGASYGGYAALAGVTIQSGLYRCAVSVAGVSDLQGMSINASQWTDGPNSATRQWSRFMGATPMNNLSPAKLADRADAPILLIHGKDDTVVPIDQSREMEAALRRVGKPVEFVQMPGEDHWLSREETRTAMLKASVDFVEKYNPPDTAAPAASVAAAP